MSFAYLNIHKNYYRFINIALWTFFLLPSDLLRRTLLLSPLGRHPTSNGKGRSSLRIPGAFRSSVTFSVATKENDQWTIGNIISSHSHSTTLSQKQTSSFWFSCSQLQQSNPSLFLADLELQIVYTSLPGNLPKPVGLRPLASTTAWCIWEMLNSLRFMVLLLEKEDEAVLPSVTSNLSSHLESLDPSD